MPPEGAALLGLKELIRQPAELFTRVSSPTLTTWTVALSPLTLTLPASAAWAAAPWLLARDAPAVLDVAYRPRETPLLRQARAAGCEAVEGVEMLICQGVAAFAIWAGLAGEEDGEGEEGVGAGTPVAEMARSVYEELERRPV